MFARRAHYPQRHIHTSPPLSRVENIHREWGLF